MSDWISVAIGGLALVLSGYTWFVSHRRQVRAGRRADVTVAFHWLPVRAHVRVPGRGDYLAGYHLVFRNRGPAAAYDIDVHLTDSEGRSLTLLDVSPDELPLSVLDTDGQYPIPWIYEPFTQHARRFEALLSWRDDAGHQQRRVPLRRGQLPT